MKKTLTINLNKTVFHIDEDAYEKLNSYLKEVKRHLNQNEDDSDIMDDIETRIAELFEEKRQHSTSVISIDEVEDIIQIMGKPSDYNEEDEQNENPKPQQTTHKKLYRDTEDQPLSGLASGLSHYLGWDVVLVRVIFVILPFITSGTFILIYLLMWLIVPKAITVSQKMEMRGEEVNIDSLNKKNMENITDSNNYQYNSGCWRVTRMGIKVIFALFIALMGIVGISLLLPLGLVGSGLIFGFNELFYFLPDTNIEITNSIGTDSTLLFIVSLLLLIIIPIALFIYWFMGRKKQTPPSKTPYWIGLILFLAGIFMFIGSGISRISKINKDELKINDVVSSYGNLPKIERILFPDDDSYPLKKQVTVAPFYQIEVSDAIQVTLKQGNQQRVLIQSQSTKDYQEITVKTKDGTLYLSAPEQTDATHSKVIVTVDTIERVSLFNVAKVNFETPFELNRLHLVLDDLSQADVQLLSVEWLSAALRGGSQLTLKGSAKNLSLETDGVSVVDALQLTTDNATVKAEGISNIQVNVLKKLRAHSDKESYIRYKGTPSMSYYHYPANMHMNVGKIE